jgi:iron complex outermembrane receptor protein
MAGSRPAAAQQSTGPSSGDALALEEVTVTAQRRVESIIDVPVSMTVLNGEQLAATAPDGLLGIAGSVPNLVYGGGAYKARPEITMRGIFSQVRNIGFDASLGVYVDGVFLGRPIAFNPSVLDIAQVEVLRGPQGSLFGKNTSSGALNVQLNSRRRALNCWSKLATATTTPRVAESSSMRR